MTNNTQLHLHHMYYLHNNIENNTVNHLYYSTWSCSHTHASLYVNNNHQHHHILFYWSSLTWYSLFIPTTLFNHPSRILRPLLHLSCPNDILSYNVVGGKAFRGTQVVNFAKHACEKTGQDFATIQPRAVALGWAIEVLQACFLVADDLMDGSKTRRGQPCWYLREDVQMDAVNDALVLESFMHFLIEEACSGLSDISIYVQLLKLYIDTCQKTQMGQTLDLQAMPQGRKSVDLLRTFNKELHTNIVKYKTAFYTFSLPMCAGLIIGGIRDAATLKAVEDVCIFIGVWFQQQDDYLDAFQDPAILGKIGTDIQDHKCSWLCVLCLEMMNDEQRVRFEANYGQHGDENVAAIKAIYNELNLTAVYDKNEEDSMAKAKALIAENKLNPAWFEQILGMVYRRKK